ncbi:MAG: formate dehydrogenase major subunit [Gaiellaceae bacterium]|nr:formate dehydrogenase major subunit [Gaiellaceae bacterium]
MPGLGTSLGRGGATDYLQDLANADCIVIMGSNMAENHPVGFQWVMEARERGAEVIHVDPRFTRTSATATKFVGIRAGSDIAFLGGIVNYIFEHEAWFDEYVKAYTNAPVIVDERFLDTEDLDGLFSGWDPELKKYDPETWQYEGMEVKSEAGAPPKGEQAGHGGAGAGMESGEPPAEDETLQHERCVFQILKRHFARYTPELVADACGCTVEEFLYVAEKLCENSGREKTGSFAYAVGWTQHTVGVQIIRTAAIIQLLLGNVGRPGGGIVALRGHASIQGSTDIPTLYNTLPGYLQMPHVDDPRDLSEWIDRYKAPTGWWGKLDTFMVSLLKAWWGPAATKENDFAFSYLPRIDDDNSAYWTIERMLEGKVKGYILAGENPAVGSANGRAQRLGMAKLDWLVVRDLVEIESAAFWYDSPEIESGELKAEEIGTEVFFLPAATHVEKDGSFTNTQRLLQWHFKAVEPKHDCRSELWFYYHLGRLLREMRKDSKDPKDRPLLDLTWSYPTSGEHADPSADAVLAEINGHDASGKPLNAYKELNADGSTSCGCWIYCGTFADGINQAARKKPHWEQNSTAPEWGWAWPANRRMLYNRASADPDGKPWSKRKELVWWDTKEQTWTGHDVPDFDEQTPPDYVPPDGAEGPDAIAGDHPFIMQADGRGWLFVPQGLQDGPLPAHYEPHESPVDNPLYRQRANPARQVWKNEDPYSPPGSEEFPYIATTYRLTEHHTAGGMSRFLPYLAELQPQMFVEVHPDLARARGLTHGGWVTVMTARSAIEGRVMVTNRMRPVRVRGKLVHQVGLPYHWGQRGLTTGGAANDLAHMALDPNVHIQEVKAYTCDVRPGRRPRGAKLAQLITDLRVRAQQP